MTPWMRTPPLPITEREVAADRLLEARKAAFDVMVSQLPGQASYEELKQAIPHLDRALRELPR